MAHKTGLEEYYIIKNNKKILYRGHDKDPYQNISDHL